MVVIAMDHNNPIGVITRLVGASFCMVRLQNPKQRTRGCV
jgi:hypothetical protein